MLEKLFLWTVSPVLFSGPGVIESPRVQSIYYGTQLSKCFAEEIRKQAPSGLIEASGDIYISGPQERRDLAPAGSVIEIVAAAPNAKKYPRFLSISIWLETPDRSLWKTKYFEDGSAEFTASAVINPAKVFDRIRARYLYDFDLTTCL